MNIELMKDILNVDIGDVTKNHMLEHFLVTSRQSLENYCQVESLDLIYDNVVMNYATYLYKNRAYIGVVKNTQGERSITLEMGIPQAIKESLPLPRVKVIG